MSVDLSKLAIFLLQGTWEYVQDLLGTQSERNSVAAEAVRLLALNEILSTWAHKKFDVPSVWFQEISLTGKLNSVNAGEISEIVTAHASECSNKLNDIKDLSILSIIDLLGIVHSIGAHTLPPRGYSQRRLHGAFYTPSAVARFIAQTTLNPIMSGNDPITLKERLSNIAVLDPCCGPGIFLAASYSVLTESLVQSSLEKAELEELYDQIASNHYGVDLDSAALEIASCGLSMMAGDTTLRKYRSQMQRGNSLVNSHRLVDGTSLNEFLEYSVARDSFEWQKEFSDVLSGGGFDVILFNPPYKRLRPNQAEYMRTRLRSESLVDMNEYEDYKRRLLDDVTFFRTSGEYIHSVSGSINTYQLFIERALDLSKEGGQIGFIVPSTLLADYSSRRLRKYLIYDNHIHQLYEFPESTRLFSGVTQSLCIGHIEKGSSTQNINVLFSLSSLDDVKKLDFLRMSIADIYGSFGNSYVIPRTSKSEWTLIKKMHRNPAISVFDWLYNHRGELDLTLDKKFIKSGLGKHPLIRGFSIGRYRLKNPLAQISEHVEIMDFKKDKETSDRVKHIDRMRIACQQISNQANQWRLKFSMIPSNVVLSNSCNYFSIQEDIPEYILDYLLGVMNSELMNWRFSISSSNNHVSNHELSQLPLVDPLDPKVNSIAQEIAAHVKAIKTPLDSHDISIESLVFSLYGLKEGEAQRVLRIRNVSPSVMDEIIESM